MPGFTGIIRTTPINDDDGLLLNRLTASLRLHDWYVCDSLPLPNGLIAQVGTGIFPYNRFSESHGIYVGLHGEIYPDSSGEYSPLDYIRDLYLKKGKLFASEFLRLDQ